MALLKHWPTGYLNSHDISKLFQEENSTLFYFFSLSKWQMISQLNAVVVCVHTEINYSVFINKEKRNFAISRILNHKDAKSLKDPRKSSARCEGQNENF